MKGRRKTSGQAGDRSGKSSSQTEAGEQAEAEQKQDDRSAEGSGVPVVGIGASAGGLEAFTELLSALPEDTGMAFVLVSHLSHSHKSMLAELLSRATPMPVNKAGARTTLRANRVYVIPSNKSLSVDDGVLVTKSLAEQRPPVAVIDIFLRSLAEKYGSKAIGVILSGTGSDGAEGLAAIKAEGGVTFVQDEASAQYSDMPRNANLAPHAADFVLPPAEIAAKLAHIAVHPYVRQGASEPGAERDAQDHLAEIFRLVHSVGGVDFTHYKPTTVKRRIARRMLLHQVDSLDEYRAKLRQDPDEVRALSKDLLIHVTGFFRDAETFQSLGDSVIPSLLENRAYDEPIRVWVAGCASGEEAYSIAICLLEAAEKRQFSGPIQIFATDVNPQAVEQAREGCYRMTIAADVSAERLASYFTKTGDGYRINKRVRDLCVFAVQNAIEDPPFSRLDLISCRNLLIYLGSQLQGKLLATFHYALKPGGYLLLGASESVGGSSSPMFRKTDPKQRIYAKLEYKNRPHLELNASGPDLDLGPGFRFGRRRSPALPGVAERADQLVLTRFAPPGVVVNAAYDIVHFRGRTGPFLEPPPGEANLNLLRMARDGLASALRAALRQAKNDNAPVHREALRVQTNGEVNQVALVVTPIPGEKAEEPYFLVLFQTQGQDETPPRDLQPASGKNDRSKEGPDAQLQVDALKAELASAQEELGRVIEEQEATNELLQSANEEVLSSNEELQSTNEELETAKEELQATNEELSTVNDELNTRNSELAKTNDDLRNLLNSIDIVYLTLDRELRIQSFTPEAQKSLNLIPGDVGRPVVDINLKIDVPDLPEQAARVIQDGSPFRSDVQDRAGKWHSMRIRPYRTEDGKVEGAILAFVDVDEARRSRDALSESERRWRSLVEDAPDFILSASQLGKILFLNRTAVSLAQGSILGDSIYDFLDSSDHEGLRACLEEVRSSGEAREFRTTKPRLHSERPQLLSRVGPIKSGNEVVAFTVKTVKRDLEEGGGAAKPQRRARGKRTDQEPD